MLGFLYNLGTSVSISHQRQNSRDRFHINDIMKISSGSKTFGKGGVILDYSFFIWSTATFIEARLKDKILYSELERTVGFSYRHIREIFKENTGISLSRYILQRRIKDQLGIKDENGKIMTVAGGQKAYDAWAEAVGNDKEFPKNAVLPLLFERIMCQNDAQCMVGEGRSYAACFMDSIGNQNDEIAKKCNQTSELFRKAAECSFKMNEPKGGFMQDEAATRSFADPLVRKQIVPLIYKAKEYEAKACEILKDIVTLL